MPTLTVRCAPHVGFIPTDDEGADYVKKHAGKLAQVKVSQPRSLEQNSMLWGVAGVCYSNLPERLTAKWADEHTMVKGLQLRLGIVDEVATWDERGWRIVATPKSIAGMEHAGATKAVNQLFEAMALLLGVSVKQLLSETARRAP